jgi:DNA (cytosine-5)-methyltransferase 1
LDADLQVCWDLPAKTSALVEGMAPLHRWRVEAAQASGERRIGALFRRTRKGAPMSEVRFDGLAGCLRTPRGGSSRQALIVVDKGLVRSRLVTAREAARLMGLPETYRLPSGVTAALTVMGDGVVAPVVRWLSAHLLEPLLRGETLDLRVESGDFPPANRGLDATVRKSPAIRR